MSNHAPQAHAPHHEMRNAANSAAFLRPHLDRLNRKDVSLLDVGCGSGSITATLAQWLPEGQVTGVDKKESVLPRARAVAEQMGVSNISFQAGDVFALPFADHSFDVVFCHTLLLHTEEPWNGLKEMLRVAKPGGFVAARESDWETECWYPPVPGIQKSHDFMSTFIQSYGGHITGGRQLLSWALKAGVKRSDIELTWGTWAYSEKVETSTWAEAMKNFVKAGPIRDAALASGKWTPADCDEIIAAWDEWAADVAASVACMHAEIVVHRR